MKIPVAPISIPAASGRITGSAALRVLLLAFLRFFIGLLLANSRRPESRKTGTLLIEIAANQN
jgi:hypothetical protein